MDEASIEEVRRAARGDEAAFGRLATRLGPRALGVARAILRDAHDAEDAVQSGLLRAYARLDRLERPEAFWGFLAAIVRNEALAHLRRRRIDACEPAWIDGTGHPGLGPMDQATRAEARRDVRAAVRGLRPAARDAVERFYMEGRSVKETSDLLGVPEGTVKRRLHDARARLRTRLAGLGGRDVWERGDEEDPSR